jgi:hypothetical protein
MLQSWGESNGRASKGIMTTLERKFILWIFGCFALTLLIVVAVHLAESPRLYRDTVPLYDVQDSLQEYQRLAEIADTANRVQTNWHVLILPKKRTVDGSLSVSNFVHTYWGVTNP